MPKHKTINPAVSEYMKSLAKKSWEKRKGKQDMSAAGKRSAEVRWGKKDEKKENEPLVKKSKDMMYEP